MSSAPVPVLVIVQTFTNHRPRDGYSAQFARFTNPAKGRDASVTLEVGGRSNADAMAYRIAGRDWEGTMCIEHDMGRRDWEYARKCSLGGVGREGDAETMAALAALFDLTPDIFDKHHSFPL